MTKHGLAARPAVTRRGRRSAKADPSWTFLWDFQALPPPNSFHARMIYVPAAVIQYTR
jgi:hypothetical protein